MSSFVRAVLAAAIAAAVLTAAHAADDLVFDGAFVRQPPPGAPVVGGYLTIVNNGSEPDRLVGAATDFAGTVAIHEMAMDGDVMKMRGLADGVEIPAGGEVALKPGGLHIMFMGLKDRPEEGETRSVTLRFEKAGAIRVDFAVAGMGATAAPDPMDHGGMDMGDDG